MLILCLKHTLMEVVLVMNTINTSDVKSALNSSAVSAMSGNVNGFGSISTALGDFCNDPQLEGELWDKVKNKLHEYTISINKGMTAISEFMGVVKEELAKLEATIGDFAETIDISKEQEISTALAQAKISYSEMEAELSKAETTYITKEVPAEGDADSEGTGTIDYAYVSTLREELSALETEITELTEMHELIVKVKAAYESAEKRIAEAYLKVAEFTTSGIATPDGKFVYSSTN